MPFLIIRHAPISIRNIMFLQSSFLFYFCFKYQWSDISVFFFRISFLGKFLRKYYLPLNSFFCLCAKEVYRCLYRKLNAVIMSSQRFYCKLTTLVLIMLLFICSGDVETNPSLKKNTKISFCHWNLNRIAGHNFSKVSLLQALATTHE